VGKVLFSTGISAFITPGAIIRNDHDDVKLGAKELTWLVVKEQKTKLVDTAFLPVQKHFIPLLPSAAPTHFFQKMTLCGRRPSDRCTVEMYIDECVSIW